MEMIPNGVDIGDLTRPGRRPADYHEARPFCLCLGNLSKSNLLGLLNFLFLNSILQLNMMYLYPMFLDNLRMNLHHHSAGQQYLSKCHHLNYFQQNS